MACSFKIDTGKTLAFSKGIFEMTIYRINVTEHVYQILHEHLGSDTTVLPQSNLLNDLGMDSLEQVELGLKLEKDFSIKLPIKDLRSCVTVQDVVEIVQRIISQKESGSI
jgi:acyl carrier protein